MQYCTLQHWTLLLSPVTYTTGCCFCFGSISSFFLELFLHCSPVAYWVPTSLGSSSFSVLSFHCLYFPKVCNGHSRQEQHYSPSLLLFLEENSPLWPPTAECTCFVHQCLLGVGRDREKRLSKQEALHYFIYRTKLLQ